MKKVIVTTGYRIHINSIDMNGFSGRCCGGLGFALDSPRLKISVKHEGKDSFIGNYPDKLKNITEKIRSFYNIKDKFEVKVLEEILEHKGLGSETQLFFSLATAILKLSNIKKGTDEIGDDLNLSGVSGIGYGAFKYGNFIVDSGYVLGKTKKDFVSHSILLPKIIYHGNIPDNWKILLVIPKNVTSISSDEENQFFEIYTPVPIDEVKEISYYTLMGVIPAIEEANFNQFIKSLNIITKLGTKKAELMINKQITEGILKKLNDYFGFGALSSLGPTCYTFIDTNNTTVDLASLKQEFNECEIFLSSVRNKPSSVEVIEEEVF